MTSEANEARMRSISSMIFFLNTAPKILVFGQGNVKFVVSITIHWLKATNHQLELRHC
jgi:hypothetical protein